MATGQALAYIDITEEEQQRLGKRPTVINMSQGLFIIPPRGRELKVARHGYGYRNLRKVPIANNSAVHGMAPSQSSGEAFMEVSVPEVGIPIPSEAEQACRAALKDIIPEMGDRSFARTRICWYCDT